MGRVVEGMYIGMVDPSSKRAMSVAGAAMSTARCEASVTTEQKVLVLKDIKDQILGRKKRIPEPTQDKNIRVVKWIHNRYSAGLSTHIEITKNAHVGSGVGAPCGDGPDCVCIFGAVYVSI